MPKGHSPISARLKEARLKSGLSQKELGIRAGIDEFTASPRINQYESGKHTPSYKTLMRLAAVLEVPVPFFYCADDRLAELMMHFTRLSSAEQKVLIAALADSGFDVSGMGFDSSALRK